MDSGHYLKVLIITNGVGYPLGKIFRLCWQWLIVIQWATKCFWLMDPNSFSNVSYLWCLTSLLNATCPMDSSPVHKLYWAHGMCILETTNALWLYKWTWELVTGGMGGFDHIFSFTCVECKTKITQHLHKEKSSVRCMWIVHVLTVTLKKALDDHIWHCIEAYKVPPVFGLVRLPLIVCCLSWTQAEWSYNTLLEH